MERTISVLLLLSITSIDNAATLNIVDYGATPNDGSDDTVAIRAAISASHSGDTVLVPSGIFRISSNVQPKSGTHFTGAGQESAVFDWLGSTHSEFITLVDKTNVEISGLTLDGLNSTAPTFGISSSNSNGLNIHDVTIKNLARSGSDPTNTAFGIYFYAGVTNSTIDRVTITNIATTSPWGSAIRMHDGSNNNTVRRSTILNMGRGGIFADHSTGSVIQDNDISGTGLSGQDALDIEAWGNSSNTLIERNTVDHWISIDNSDNSAARFNTIRSVAPSADGGGLELVGSHDVVFTDNHVGSGAHIGFNLSNSNGSRASQYLYLARNDVDGAETWGAQFQADSGGASRIYVFDNVFTHTNAAPPNLYSSSGHGFRVNANGSITNVVFDSNDFTDNDANGFQLTGGGADAFSFINNRFTDNADASIDSFGGQNLEWEDNLVSGNGINRSLSNKGFTGDPAPSIALIAPANLQPGVAANFTFSFSDNGTLAHALWDFGEGLPATGQNASHTFTEPGIYHLGLVVWDNTGRAAHLSVPLVVGQIGLPGDFNGDGSVDAADYVFLQNYQGTQQDYERWKANFGQTGSGLPGDFNGDGKVDAADYILWRKQQGTQQDYERWKANFGQTGSGLLSDFNGDGKVDAADYVLGRKQQGTQQEYSLWRDNFGKTNPDSNSMESVPEPGSTTIALLALTAEAWWAASVRLACSQRRNRSVS